jgi:hypothetical protein
MPAILSLLFYSGSFRRAVVAVQYFFCPASAVRFLMAQLSCDGLAGCTVLSHLCCSSCRVKKFTRGVIRAYQNKNILSKVLNAWKGADPNQIFTDPWLGRFQINMLRSFLFNFGLFFFMSSLFS